MKDFIVAYRYHPNNNEKITRYSTVHPHDFDKLLHISLITPLYDIKPSPVYRSMSMQIDNLVARIIPLKRDNTELQREVGKLNKEIRRLKTRSIAQHMKDEWWLL